MLTFKLPQMVGIALLFSTASSIPSNSYDCCKALQQAGLDVYLPTDAVYVQQIQSYWSLTAQLTPYCIVQPEDADDVSKTVKTLVQETECKFAVRSGGHSSNPGFNNIDDGVTIDLTQMNGVTYNDASGTASILPATRWMQVYQTLDPLGRGVPGGRLGQVGVAGLVTGGGFSYYLYREGLVCDNVRNFEVVLASGDIVNANADENADLWTALKGGMSNFGVVTRLDLNTFPTPGIWGGRLQYESTAATTDAMVRALVDWTDNIENYQNGSVILFWHYVPAEKQIFITASLNDVGGRVAAPAFDQFLSIPGNISSTITAKTNMSTLALVTQAEGYRDIWFTVAFKNDERVIRKAVELHNALVEEMKLESSDGNFTTQAFFQPFPTIVAKHSVRKSGNILGIDSIEENAVVLLGSIAVNGVDQEVLSRRKMQAWKEAVEDYSRSVGAYVEYRYANYADKTQDVVRTYGEENIRKMHAVSEKFDTDGVFQTRAPGGFKLPVVG